MRINQKRFNRMWIRLSLQKSLTQRGMRYLLKIRSNSSVFPHRESSCRGGRVDTLSSCQVVHEANRFCCQHESDGNSTLKLECGCALPFLACLVEKPIETPDSKHLPVSTGRVNGVKASLLRHTGCTTISFVVGLLAKNSLLKNSGIIACRMVQSGEQHFSHGGY